MTEDSEIVLVGGGIMSFTLATLLKELNPALNINIYEMLDSVGMESSMHWNNAGTGHQALCETNYTPMSSDGKIDTTKAIKINQQYELSREFWAYCVENKILKQPNTFYNNVPHMSFCTDSNVEYLKARYEAMKKIPLFQNMQFSSDFDQIAQWAPLLVENRNKNQKIAATYMQEGSDVNFSEIVHQLYESLSKKAGFNVFLRHKVKNLHKTNNGWILDIKDLENGVTKQVNAKFVFLGAGGGSFPLLQKSNIPEGYGYGGFPVGGLWLVCSNREVIEKHKVKVYGKASIGDPPMSLPHLDSRIIDGKKELLFGPYAGFNTKFLKRGSFLDFPLSISSSNITNMIQAGIDNVPLTIYLIKQILSPNFIRLKKLKTFMPSAVSKDWSAKFAGQRVQIIKKGKNGRGSLEFGTDVVTSADGSLAALLGASPGASVCVDVMLAVISKCFKDQMKTSNWQDKIKQMVPSYNQTLQENIATFNEHRSKTAKTLNIPFAAL